MTSLRSKGKKVPKPCRYIAISGLNVYNQLIINKYIEILSPLKEAISLVEGRGKASKHSAIQEVILMFNWLLKVFKEKKDCVTKAIEDYFIINLNAAQIKLNDYYLKLNNTLVYYVVVLLYSYFKRFYQNTQKDRPNQIISGDAAF